MPHKGSGIGSDPFAVPKEAQDPVRRFRGRLPAPVTVWTTYGHDARSPVGITVSSLLVAEGEPASVVGLVGDLTDFWEAAKRSRRMVVHILNDDQADLAEKFALRYPGDPFATVDHATSEYGPLLAGLEDRLMCKVDSYMPVGFGVLVKSTIERVDLTENPPSPLVHLRGAYRRLSS